MVDLLSIVIPDVSCQTCWYQGYVTNPVNLGYYTKYANAKTTDIPQQGASTRLNPVCQWLAFAVV